MEAFGFLVLFAGNSLMSFIAILWFLFGGFEVGNVLTSLNKGDKYFWFAFTSLNVWFWSLLIGSSPFSITVS